jgi:hypothetical protein
MRKFLHREVAQKVAQTNFSAQLFAQLIAVIVLQHTTTLITRFYTRYAALNTCYRVI